MTPNDSLLIALSFIKEKWFDRAANEQDLIKRQRKKLDNYIRTILPLSPRFSDGLVKSYADIPYMDKTDWVDHFDSLNTANITLEEAQKAALQSEISRDFSPTIRGYSVGLSSGTSGCRAVFVISREERLRWAGIILAKILPNDLLRQLLNPLRPALQVAFFLRANNNLYESVNSSRLHIVYYDISSGFDHTVDALNAQNPDVLIAPASILATIARLQENGTIRLNPKNIFSVAETLETDDSELIKNAFHKKPMQIYQATEGFLGCSCPHGNIHLNETYLYIEKDWIDAARTRFHPVVTDFSRRTQIVVRYRMNDILVLPKDRSPCSCGNPETVIERIEGRADEILTLKSADGSEQPIYPETLRRSMMLVEDIDDYRIEQQDIGTLTVRLHSKNQEKVQIHVQNNLNILWNNIGVLPPAVTFLPWVKSVHGAKRRRIINKMKESA